ncbi:sialoadhesin-like [Paramisgurnus dabryanus]|uniref:sialoadhesin-like n=1 Tax=Paramisgurnus dabryanus TaxID=90735 RepID=UPI003CCFD5F6
MQLNPFPTDRGKIAVIIFLLTRKALWWGESFWQQNRLTVHTIQDFMDYFQESQVKIPPQEDIGVYTVLKLLDSRCQGGQLEYLVDWENLDLRNIPGWFSSSPLVKAGAERRKHCDPEMKGLIYLLFQGVLLYETLAWEVRMPTEIHGLKGSCLVIPCSYSYTLYPPTNPLRVVWYQWVSKAYPLVYDPLYPDYVIDKFRGQTDIYRHTNSDRDCSLLIKSVEPSHSGEKLYAWIDPENIGWRTYEFYDVTSTIIVYTNPPQPIINISGGLKTGDSITVACYTLHTCPYSKPNITLKGIEGSDNVDDVRMENGQWKATRTRTGVVKAERSDIECTVTHHGGITTRATKSQSAKCVHSSITIQPELAADIIEGVPKTFTCTVHHSCLKNPPILSWNYENMPVKDGKKQLTGFEWATFSTITFLGAKKDDGKKLICSTNISGQKITASVDLHILLQSLQNQ